MQLMLTRTRRVFRTCFFIQLIIVFCNIPAAAFNGPSLTGNGLVHPACLEQDYTIWSAIDRMDAGQLIGMIMLAVFMVASIAVIVERCITYAAASKQSRAYESRALTALYYNRVTEAVSVSALFPKSPAAVALSACLGITLLGSCPATITPSKPALQRALVAQIIEIKRGLWLLAAIAWSSPSLGLLISIGPWHRYRNDDMLGLFFGLCIAVPTMCMYRYLSARAEELVLETDKLSRSIVGEIVTQLNGAQHRRPVSQGLPASPAPTFEQSSLGTRLTASRGRLDLTAR